jgi:hypothetical protein
MGICEVAHGAPPHTGLEQRLRPNVLKNRAAAEGARWRFVDRSPAIYIRDERARNAWFLALP